MRFIVDQQLPPILAEWLRDGGLDAVHVREIGLRDEPDHSIWRRALTDAAVIISRDSDFMNFARQDLRGRLLWLRIGNCSNPALISAFELVWPAALARLQAGERLVEVRP